jgi:hypothetical protein
MEVPIRPLSIVLLALVLGNCSQAPRPSAPGVEASRTVGATPEGGGLERALSQALERRSWSDLRIDTECRTDAGYHSARVFTSGVGIWNRERQLTLSRKEVLALLGQFQAAGFPRMRETYGEDSEKDAALELICRVRLELDGAVKQAAQLSKGRTSPELMALAGHILKVAEEAARSGLGADSLTQGMERIARGELAPELLSLHVVRQSEAPGAQEGWQLDLEGSRATVRRNPAPEGEEPRTIQLTPAEIAGLAGQLAAARWDELPVNLWAPEYTDLQIEVLKGRRSLQARQFAEMTSSTHGEAQQRFDRAWEAVEALRQRLLSQSPSSSPI